jgi:hypothetical protein
MTTMTTMCGRPAPARFGPRRPRPLESLQLEVLQKHRHGPLPAVLPDVARPRHHAQVDRPAGARQAVHPLLKALHVAGRLAVALPVVRTMRRKEVLPGKGLPAVAHRVVPRPNPQHRNVRRESV